MKKKQLSMIGIFLVFIAVLFVYPLDSYVSQPGGAYQLEPLVKVEDGDVDREGTFRLMTISVGKATPLSYVLAKFSETKKILPASHVRKSGESDKDYNVRQKRLMSSSQFNAITVAFEKVGKPVDVTYNGVFVATVLERGAAEGILETGDIIKAVDNVKLEKVGQFFELIGNKQLGDEITLAINRDKKSIDVRITLKEIPDSGGVIGLGVMFEEDRTLKTNPKVNFLTSNIGGPSAGLMFTLEIMDQLIEENLTKGYNIAGTGEMLEDGKVGRIGGADFKVVAADREDVEIFFAPDDDLPEEVRAANPGIKTNYEEALEMAKKIGTKMKIVPVKTVDDAIKYLDELEAK